MSFKLVSFTVCPFVQRAVLMLEEKAAEYEVAYIDLRNKPDWFLQASPRGKVPLLFVGEEVLFESQAICEYLEEVAPGAPLFPEDPVQRARDRAWFSAASEDLLTPIFGMMSAKDKEGLAEGTKKVRAGLDRLEQTLEGREWLSGEGARFGMADVGYCSALWQLSRVAALFGHDLFEGFDRVSAWRDRVLARPTLPRSVPGSYDDDLQAMLQNMGSDLLA